MPQERVCVGSLQEYPGATVWHDYHYRCPECKKMGPSATVSTTINGEEHFLCQSCVMDLHLEGGE